VSEPALLLVEHDDGIGQLKAKRSILTSFENRDAAVRTMKSKKADVYLIVHQYLNSTMSV
jgi:hypothetical protein